MKIRFLVDSISVPVAHIAREHSRTVCREAFHSLSHRPDQGCCAITNQHYIGYKLSLVATLDGGYHSMEMTPANLYDVHYLKDLRQSGLQDCLVLADKG
jgi:hypothetical protein